MGGGSEEKSESKTAKDNHLSVLKTNNKRTCFELTAINQRLTGDSTVAHAVIHWKSQLFHGHNLMQLAATTETRVVQDSSLEIISLVLFKRGESQAAIVLHDITPPLSAFLHLLPSICFFSLFSQVILHQGIIEKQNRKKLLSVPRHWLRRMR